MYMNINYYIECILCIYLAFSESPKNFYLKKFSMSYTKLHKYLYQVYISVLNTKFFKFFLPFDFSLLDI